MHNKCMRIGYCGKSTLIFIALMRMADEQKSTLDDVEIVTLATVFDTLNQVHA